MFSGGFFCIFLYRESPCISQRAKTSCYYHRFPKGFFLTFIIFNHKSQKTSGNSSPRASTAALETTSSGIFLHRHRHTHFFSKSCTTHILYSGNTLFRTIWNSASHRQCQRSVNFESSLFLICGWVNCQEATGPRHSVPQQYTIIQLVAHSCHCKLILQSHHLEQLVPTHGLKKKKMGIQWRYQSCFGKAGADLCSCFWLQLPGKWEVHGFPTNLSSHFTAWRQK